jgi:hypothetical protein
MLAAAHPLDLRDTYPAPITAIHRHSSTTSSLLFKIHTKTPFTQVPAFDVLTWKPNSRRKTTSCNPIRRPIARSVPASSASISQITRSASWWDWRDCTSTILKAWPRSARQAWRRLLRAAFTLHGVCRFNLEEKARLRSLLVIPLLRSPSSENTDI